MFLKHISGNKSQVNNIFQVLSFEVKGFTFTTNILDLEPNMVFDRQTEILMSSSLFVQHEVREVRRLFQTHGESFAQRGFGIR